MFPYAAPVRDSAGSQADRRTGGREAGRAYVHRGWRSLDSLVRSPMCADAPFPYDTHLDIRFRRSS
jgi:hypothetical protein